MDTGSSSGDVGGRPLDARPHGPPVVLVVEDDEAVRGLLRLALELEGAAVLEATSVSQARDELCSVIDAVVLDRRLPDGDGLELVPTIRRKCPQARIVLSSAFDDDRGQWPTLPRVEKGDVGALVDALGIGAPGTPPLRLAAVGLMREEADQLLADWRELCRWDPLLPPSSQPAEAPRVLSAVGAALDRPQPLGFGPDPDVEEATEAFAAEAASIDVAVEELVCLREVLRRRIISRVPADELPETVERLQMVMDRAIGVAVRLAS